MAKQNDRTGKRCGCVTVLRDSGLQDKYRNKLWECLCDCGLIRNICSNYLNRMEKEGAKPCRCLPRTDYRIGMKFGRLTVTKKLPPKTPGGHSRYVCRCDCGNESTVESSNLLYENHTTSCGCYQKERASEVNSKHGLLATKDGKPTDRRWRMWAGAKKRSKNGEYYPFDLEPLDIVIPSVCPLLGVRLVTKNTEMRPNSPTLDRILPEKGYTKDNVWVISARANTIKNDASLEELQLLTRNLEKKIKEGL